MASHTQGGPDDRSPIGELTTSIDGVVLQVNRTVLRWTGLDRETVQGSPMHALLSPGSQLYYETQYRPLLQLHGRIDGVALDLRTSRDEDFPVLVAAVRDGGPAPEALVHVRLFPAGARASHEREVRRSRGRAWRSEARLRLLHDLRAALLSALEPRDVLDAVGRGLTTHTRGGIVAIWLTGDDGSLGLALGSATDLSPAQLRPEDDLPPASVARAAAPRSFPAAEVRQRWPAVGRSLEEAEREVLLVAPLVAEGAVLGVVQVALRRDWVEAADELAVLAAVGVEAGHALLRCELPAHLQGLPLRDALTGTATPALFGERIGGALARAADGDEPLAVLLLDVAAAADEARTSLLPDDVLARVGSRLEGAGDSVARIGRQRFGLLREDCSPSDARRWAELLQQTLEQQDRGGQPISVSIGGVVVEPVLDGRSVTVGDVLAWASTALASAVTNGPRRPVVHPAARRQTVRALVQAERVVRRALAEDGVVVHYQPVVHLRTGRVLGVEALCRLRMPNGSLMQPADFIDAAEDSGLLLPLGRRALMTACAQQAEWAAGGHDLDVAVNVAASQAADPGFTDDVLEALETTGCAPSHLVLELTESALLAATPTTLGAFTSLRAEGVRVALDDFGTRYASLDYVRSFPLDELKIDQSFVAGLPGSRVARAIVRMVAALAAELDLVCVAEGIETAAQAHFLNDLGVLGQGFAVGHPVPREDVVAWLTPASWLTAAQPLPEEQQA